MPGRPVKYFTTIFAAILITAVSWCQPAGYYSSADGKTGTTLQQALHDIIDNHTVLTYADLWTAFQTTDKKADGKVWDMYSDIPGGTPAYVYQFITDQCGNYAKESDCYNREHSFPKSWFDDLYPMYTDLFHLYPTDGFVNGKRANYPYGVVTSPTWTSTNGSKLGNCTYPGYTGIVFEPVNGYKGDLARTYLYMAVRYYKEDSGWTGSDMVTGSQPKEWALKMLLEWHKNDPVSQKETERNNAVYILQGNRNPFIDNPAYADLIWSSQSGSESMRVNKAFIRIYPVPAKDKITVEVPDGYQFPAEYSVTGVSGVHIYNGVIGEGTTDLDISRLKPGLYILKINGGSGILYSRFIVSGL